MAPPLTEVRDIQLQLTTHLSTRRDERLSWPGWLTCSGRFTHISGHPSATGQAQDRESTPAKDRRSTTEPRNQPTVVRCQIRTFEVARRSVVRSACRWLAGDSRAKPMWRRVVMTTVDWICGIEKPLAPTAHQNAEITSKQTSLDELPLLRTLCDINALVLTACAVFLSAFFAWPLHPVSISTCLLLFVRLSCVASSPFYCRFCVINWADLLIRVYFSSSHTRNRAVWKMTKISEKRKIIALRHAKTWLDCLKYLHVCKVFIKIRSGVNSSAYIRNFALIAHRVCCSIFSFSSVAYNQNAQQYVQNDTIQYSPEAVRYPCTNCLLPAFADA